MQRAVNPATGETVFLVDNQWVAPTQVAKNDAGQFAFLINNQWVTPPPPVDSKPSVLAGTTLPADAPPMGNRMISEVGTPNLSEVPKFDVSKMPTEAEKAAATFGLTPEMGAGEKALRTAKAAAYGASTALQQTWLGGARIIADLSGTHQDDVKGVSKQLAKEQGAVEKTFEDNYGLKIAKNIGESVLANVPTIYTGLAAGLPAAYTTMFGQSFLQTYDDSRNEGLNVAQSTARSALFGAAEVLGERIGLPTLFKGIKDIGAGVSAKELAKTAANFVMKDLAGEELTYLSQYLTDLGFGLNPQASLEQFFQGAVDTALVTIGQGAVMGGAGMASNKILKEIRNYNPDFLKEDKTVLQQGKNVTVEGAPPIPPSGTPAPAGPQDLGKFKALEDQDIEEQDKEKIDRLDALEAEFKLIDEKYKTAKPSEFGELNKRQGQITKEINDLIAGGVTPPTGAPKASTEEERKEKSSIQSSTAYTVNTEDAGTFPVRIMRMKDGSVDIIDDKGHVIKTNKDFAKGKSDADLLAYHYEPLGYQSYEAAKKETTTPAETIKKNIFGLPEGMVFGPRSIDTTVGNLKNNDAIVVDGETIVVNKVTHKDDGTSDLQVIDRVGGLSTVNLPSNKAIKSREIVPVKSIKETQKVQEEKPLTLEEKSAFFEKNRIARQREAAEKAKSDIRTPLKEVTDADLLVANKAMDLAGKDVEMADEALPYLKKLETAGLIRIKPGRRKSFTLTNSGEALRGAFYDMSHQEKQAALKDFLQGSPVKAIEEKPKNELEKLMEIEERLESPTISKTSVIPHATVMVAPYKDGFVSSYQYHGKVINGQDTGQSISTPLDLEKIYSTREVAIKAAARKIRERAEVDKNKVALDWLETVAPKPKAEKLDSISFELDGDKVKVEYFLDSDGVYTRRDTEVYKENPKKEIVSELTFSQYKDEEPGWAMAATIQSMDMQPLLVTRAEAQRMIAAERKEAEKFVAEAKAAKEKPKTKAEVNKERQAKKKEEAQKTKEPVKEVHIEGKKEEPVTSKTIEKAVAKAGENVDYAKIKKAAENQVDQAIKRAKFATQKEYNDAKVPEADRYVTIKLEGDGSFKVMNNKERLEDFKKKLANAIKPKQAGTPRREWESAAVGFKSESAVKNFLNENEPDLAVAIANLTGLDITKVPLNPTQRKILDRYIAEQKESGDNEPMMETIKSKPGANVKNLANLLGPQLYGSIKDIGDVSVKEMLQNSFDAIKTLLENKTVDSGIISINASKSERTITVKDNGSGMSPDVLANTFLQIAGTKKETEFGSGGFGIAKMLFLYGNQNVEVITMRDGKIARMKSQPGQLMSSLEDVSQAPDIKITTAKETPDLADMFPLGHGTSVTVTIPETYKDTSTGETKDVDFDDSKYSYAVLRYSPLFANIRVLWNGDDIYDMGSKFEASEYDTFVNAKFDWGTARIYVSNEQNDTYGKNLHVLSNGLWQFSENLKLNPQEMFGKNIPHRFYLDVVSKVKPQEEGYPFQLNRQGFTKQAEEDLKAIKNYLTLHYRQQDFSSSVKNFGSVQYLSREGKNINKSEKVDLVPNVTPEEKIEGIKVGAKVEVKNGELIVNGKKVPILTPDDLKKASIDFDALKIDQSEIDPNKVMIHDNLEVQNGRVAKELAKKEALSEKLYDERNIVSEKITNETDPAKKAELRKESTKLLDEQIALIDELKVLRAQAKDVKSFTPITVLAKDKFGDRFDKFMFDIGDTFMALRDAVVSHMPVKKNGEDYSALANEAVGISFDKEYRGVSIVLPFKGLYINPAFPEYIDTPEEAALGMFGTMIHELAHHKVRNHGADFPAEMQRILIKLESSTSFDINQLKKDFILTVKENKDIIDFLNEEGSNESNRAIGQRFKDSSNQARGEDTSEDVSGQREQGRGESGIPSELRPSYQAIGKKRQPESVSSEDEGELESFREAYLAQREADGREDFKLKTSKSVKDMLLGSYGAAREAAKAVKESPMLAVNKMTSKLDRAITYARIKGVWYGRGLEVAEVKKFNGKVKDGQEKAIATVALTNALHSGEIMSQVIMRGKLMFDTESQMFRAEDAKESLANVMLAKHDLIERVGAQEANNMIQDYFEAKRSRSILNAFQKQEGIVEKAKEKAEKIEFGTDAYYDALDEVEKAKNDFYNIAVARSKVKLSDESIDIYSALEDDNPELRNMMDNWQAVNSNNLDNMEFSGLISKKRAKSLHEIEDYVPWQRIQDEMEDVHSAPVRGSTKSLTNVAKEKVFKRNAAVNKAAREYIDGEIDLDQFNEAIQLYQENLGEIDDILDNMLHNTAVLGRNSMRNHAANMIASRYAERYTEGKKAGKLKIYREEGRDDNGVRLNIVVNGKRVIVNIPDPLIAEAVVGMENINMPAVEIFAVMANLLRRGITTWPQFQLRQLFMDAPTAAMVSGLGAKNSAILYADTFKSFLNALNSEDPIVRHLKAYGIGGFQSYTRSPEQQYKQQIGLIEQNKLDQFTNILDKIGDASDMAQRIATYKRVLAETGDETLALMRSNNIIDFKKHGNAKMVVAITRSVSFMNAYAQQLDVLAEALAGGGLKGKNRAAAFGSMLKVAAMLTMWTTIYTWIMGGNDDYEKMDDQKKARNFVIPKNLTKHIGVDDNILLPMNTSAAYFFKAMPELITNYVLKKGTKNEVDFTRLRKSLSEAAIDSLLGPNPIATGVKPFVEIGLNRNFFTGGAITPKGLEGLDAAEQYNASTSELGKILSAVAGGVLNPIEMDHLVRGIFGTNGAVVMWGSNMLSGDRPTAEQKDNPLWGGLMDRDVGRGPEALFYDLKSEVEPKHKTFMKLIEREKDKEADQYFTKHEKEIAAYEYVTGIESALKEINKEIRRVSEVRDPKFSKDDRRKEIQELQRTKNDILSDVIQIRKEAGL